MATIPLNGKHGTGKFTEVDDSDFEMLSTYKWNLSNCGYAIACRDGKLVRMHRLLTNAPNGMHVDHVNHDKLDNRRMNLRVCTPHQNRMNLSKPKGNTYRFKGVSRRGKTGSWVALISHGGQLEYLGVYETEDLAARAYDFYAVKYFGEFASLNFPNEIPTLPARVVGNGRTGYKGVYSKEEGKYFAKIGFDNKRAYLGTFDNPHDAARMYNFWALDIFGDKTTINKIEEEFSWVN
ncbi:putative HNH endonuclease III [uncultured Caudovirales phage]|uniref:Putative HNH endonuclease III n=1 Tax=uncultured Caudovirales phage TaxID=2100421 RepID=A0A2H4J6F5_9CAUD|nr:putative HNH endonuclease III [uncultured Caudovirales phage]